MAIAEVLTIIFPTRSEPAKEGSSYVIPVRFKDGVGTTQAPSAIAWGLSSSTGASVNSRENEQVSSPSGTVNILLTPSDLAISDGSRRYLTVKAKYNSDDYGIDLYITGEEEFTITDLVGAIPSIDGDSEAVTSLEDATILTDETELADA